MSPAATFSLKAFIQSLDWPEEGFVPTRETNYDYPSNSSPGYTDKLQGVTHDDYHWYFTQEDRLHRFDVGQNLDNPHEDTFTHIPIDNYRHMGDIDFYEGLIYVPLEGWELVGTWPFRKEKGLPALVAIFDQELHFKGSAPLTAQGTSGPWCAVNPLNGLLYSSAFNDEPDHLRLQVYQRNFNPSFELKHVGTMELFDESGQPLILGGLQGAAFSKQGHFYLVVDTTMKSADNDNDRGIMGFDMITGRRVVHTLVDYHPWKYFPTLGWKKIQELEGITIWEDVGALGAPGIRGQLHLIMVDLNWIKNDCLFFKHYEVANPGDLGKV